MERETGAMLAWAQTSRDSVCQIKATSLLNSAEAQPKLDRRSMDSPPNSFPLRGDWVGKKFDFVDNPKNSQFWLCIPTGVTLACHHWSLWAHSGFRFINDHGLHALGLSACTKGLHAWLQESTRIKKKTGITLSSGLSLFSELYRCYIKSACK